MSKRILTFLFWGVLTIPAFAQVVISEIRIDQPSSDNDEYFELCNVGVTSIDISNFTYLVLGDNGGGSSGVIEAVIPLFGIMDPGDCWIWTEDSYSLSAPCSGGGDSDVTLNFENSDNVTHILVDGFTGSNGDDLDTDDDCTLDFTPWTTIVDGLALVESTTTGECNYTVAPIMSIGPDGSNVPGHVFRNASGIWNIGNFDPVGGDDNPCGLGMPPCNQLDEWVFEILSCSEFTALGTYEVRIVVDGQASLDSTSPYPILGPNLIGTDSFEFVLTTVPSGEDYYLRFLGADCTDTLIREGFVNCDVCSLTSIDPSFSYGNEMICAFNTILPPIFTTGLSGTFAYSTINGGPTLSIEPLTGEINTSFSDPGLYEITNTLQGCGRLIISGVIDGPLAGGVPKAVEFYALEEIANLSQYSFGSANNGGGSNGMEFTFPATSVPAGTYIYVCTEETSFNAFFSFTPHYVSFAANINGDDAIELFCGGTVIDVFGDPNLSGSGQPWEYTDGWAYRNDNRYPNFGDFNPSDWTFSAPNALVGEDNNNTAATPFPIGTFVHPSFMPSCLDSVATDTLELLFISTNLNPCQDEVYLSLDNNCEVAVTSGMLISGPSHICYDLFPVQISDHLGRNIGTTLTEFHRGKKLTYKVSDGQNACWGNLIVEDKLPPQVVCNDTAISCLQGYEEDHSFIDNCGFQPQVEILENTWVDNTCNGDTVGYYNRKIFVQDVWGNSNDCEQKIYILRETLDSLYCDPDPIIVDCCNPKLRSFLTNTFDEKNRAHPIPYFISGINIGLVDPPYINGFPITEIGDKCNINATYKDIVLEDCGASYKIRRMWKIYDWCENRDTTCVQYIKILDTMAPEVEAINPVTAYVSPHECKGHIDLDFPWINKECSADQDLKTFYQTEYFEDNRKIVVSGEIISGEIESIYLPKGDYTIEYRIVDQCWNESYAYQKVWMLDNISPTPVCDEITQVTLDPDKCRVRVYAKNLDDGSNDNCCEELHFAVASMMEINAYRDSVNAALLDCVGEYDFNHYSSYYKEFVEYLINCFVFDEYIDLEECGTDTLVLRVYEACGFPEYDPHIFKGSIHNWYCFNQYDDYACRYLIQYNEIDPYSGPMENLLCYSGRIDYEDFSFGCSFAKRENYEEVEQLSYQPVVLSTPAIGAGSDTAFTLILDRPILIYGLEYYAIKVATAGYISTDLEDDGTDGSNDCLLPKDFSSGGGDRLYVLHSGEFGSEINYEYFHNSPYSHPNGSNIGVHVISWLTTSGELFQVLIFDNGDLIYQYDRATRAERYTIGAQTLKGDYYTNIACNGNRAILGSMAVGLSPWGTNMRNSPFCIKPYQAEKNDLWCNYMTDTLHPLYTKWLDLESSNPELTSLINRRIEFPSWYSDCMIEVRKDDKTPPVCQAPESTTFYCDGVPLEWSVEKSYLNGTEIEKIAGIGASFAHDICGISDALSTTCYAPQLHVDLFIDGQLVGYNICCIETPWMGDDHGYYGGPAIEDYQSEIECEDNFSLFPTDWKPIYCWTWLLLDQYDTNDSLPKSDEAKPNFQSYFGVPQIKENCWNPSIDSTTKVVLDECGSGYLTRSWTVTDKCGNSSTCQQIITIIPRSDFEVKFPMDQIIYCEEAADLSPVPGDQYSYPIIADDDCELIGITYADKVLDIPGTGCYKILRTWKVIDWCVYSPDIHDRYPDVIVNDTCYAGLDRPCIIRNLKDDGDGYMTYVQVIKIIDDTPPAVTCNADYIGCIFDEHCDELFVEYDLGNAFDNCTQNVSYRYAINLFGDSGSEDWIYGTGSSVQNYLPVGNHEAILFARDDCGNESYCNLTINVRDCKPPTPYCYSGIATVVMPSNGSIAVWAKDLNAGSFDNCTDGAQLRYTFGPTAPLEDSVFIPEENSSYKIFGCNDLGDQFVEIYVWDESGNVDFCSSNLLIQAGGGCKDSLNSTLKEIGDIALNNLTKNSNYSESIANRITSNQLLESPSLQQNIPNPFTERTVISFSIPKTISVKLLVIDMKGKVVLSKEGVFDKGIHQIEISDLRETGIYYYQLISDNFMATRKMIRIH